MPQRNRRAKRRGAGKRRQGNEADGGERGKNLDSLSADFNDKSLLEIKTILNVTDLSNVPVILAAVVLNRPDAVRRFIAKGRNVNERGTNSLTGLIWAVKCKRVEMVDLLLSNGADPTVEDSSGNGILCIALKSELWDEKSFVGLWDRVKAVCYDFTRKKLYEVLCLLIQKEWNEMLDMVIKEEINVDMLKEDITESNHLRLAISNVINRNIHLLYMIYNKLTAIFREKGISLKTFFEKAKKYVKGPLQVVKFLIILNEILKYLEKRPGAETEGTELLEKFTAPKAADMRLPALKSCSFHDCSFIPLFFSSLAAACARHLNAESLLNRNSLDVRPSHPSFLILQQCYKKGAQFNRQIIRFYRECSKIRGDSEIDTEREQRANPKKTRRRARAIKAKVFKLRSADLDDPSNPFLDTFQTKDEAKTNRANFNGRNAEWSQYSAWEQTWLLESGNNALVKNFRSTIGILEDRLGFEVDEDMFNVNFSVEYKVQDDAKQAQLQQDVSLYPDWINKAHSESCQLHNECPKIEFYEQPIEEAANQEETRESIQRALNYLSLLLQKITITYQSHWEHDKRRDNLLQGSCGYANNNMYQKRNNPKSVIERLEAEHLQRVKAEFDKLALYIRNNAENHISECYRIIDQLENTLLDHKIRGRSIIEDVPEEIIDLSKNVDPSLIKTVPTFCKIRQKVAVPNCMERCFGHINSCSTTNIAHPTGDKFSTNLKKREFLPRKSDPEKIEHGKLKTMQNYYHLIPSLISICDEDDQDVMTNKEVANTEKLYHNTKLWRWQNLQETLFAIPELYDSNRLLEALENIQPGTICSFPLDATLSKWYRGVLSLQRMKNWQVLLNGDIRISCKDKEKLHIIAKGGNFSPVVLGLDVNDRPLAVKRIRKDRWMCKTLKSLLNPLLGLRNTNLLHYFACNYEENELIVATPLCEFNMGEYVTLLKRVEMSLKINNVVRQFLAGLRFLHDRSEPVVHGNLKPSNIFIDLNGVVRIAEFGMHEALYTLVEASNSSIIWFSRETFSTFMKTSCISCTCASDIQVAGMLIHFIFTGGCHPFGNGSAEILRNLERAVPRITVSDVDLQDLISWMLLYEPGERPAISQVVSHVFFWDKETKWCFILACAGISPRGTPLDVDVAELHGFISDVAMKENIKGNWIDAVKKQFPSLAFSPDDQDNIVGLLKFIHNCIKNQTSSRVNEDDKFCHFILSSFSALPLSLYRILESSRWLKLRAFLPFTTVNSFDT